MKYSVEKLLISEDGEIFRPGEILDITWRKNLSETTTNGRYCGYERDMYSTIHIKIDISKDLNSNFAYIEARKIKNISR